MILLPPSRRPPRSARLSLISWQLLGGVLCFFGERSQGCRSDQFRLTSLHSWTDGEMKAEWRLIVSGRIYGSSTLPSSFYELASQPVSIYPSCGFRNKQTDARVTNYKSHSAFTRL